MNQEEYRAALVSAVEQREGVIRDLDTIGVEILQDPEKAAIAEWLIVATVYHIRHQLAQSIEGIRRMLQEVESSTDAQRGVTIGGLAQELVPNRGTGTPLVESVKESISEQRHRMNDTDRAQAANMESVMYRVYPEAKAYVEDLRKSLGEK